MSLTAVLYDVAFRLLSSLSHFEKWKPFPCNLPCSGYLVCSYNHPRGVSSTNPRPGTWLLGMAMTPSIRLMMSLERLC